MSMMLSRRGSFPECPQLTAQMHQRTPYLRQLKPYEMYFINNKKNSSFVHELQNACCVHNMKAALVSLWIFISSLSMSSNILKDFFSQLQFSKIDKIFRNHVVNRGCHLWFDVSFIEHEQSRFSIILKGKSLGLSDWQISIGFKLVHSCISPKKSQPVPLKVWSEALTLILSSYERPRSHFLPM
jgi:hypothetical protein